MDWWMYIIIGWVLGFISTVGVLVIYGRRQIKEALAPFKGK